MQLAVASQKPRRSSPCLAHYPPLSPYSPSPRLRVAPFTLVEMLVVMAIIVLALLMAIPTIRYMTGSKSTQAAENTMAAMLVLRSDAIALQQPQGVLFLLDLATGRTEVVEVMKTTNSYPTDPTGVVYLDLVADRDPLFLPPGIGALDDQGHLHASAQRKLYRSIPELSLSGLQQ